MRIRHWLVVCVAVLAAAAPALAANPAKPGTGAPIRVDINALRAKKPHYAKFNKVSAAAKADPTKIVSVPHWTGSFFAKGQTWPYTMVGRNPKGGGMVQVDTLVFPVNFVFDCCVDAGGNPITLEVTAALEQKVAQSPNFGSFAYSSGTTQFGDAVQRAEFFNTMGPAWHTLMGTPQFIQPVTIEVPFEFDPADPSFPLYGFPVTDASGDLFALVDINFFVSQLVTMLQLQNINVNQFPIFLTNDVVYYEDQSDPFGSCCIVGFHSAYEKRAVGVNHYVQTLATMSWTDDFLFGPNFTDVVALSHEISEWMNDPFINNAVPVWQFPLLPAGFCQDNLETGDPIEVFDNPAFPVTMPNGFTYHPQVEALLPWFARESPSSALGGVFSYPNTTLLTHPARDCGVVGPP